ncbi:MAG TPA: transcriptional repressor [Firmicutes bacterium]|nr:transcriptional repressor [Bacillota bacterium]
MIGCPPQQAKSKPVEGFRITPQRRVILETLKSHPGRHLTAEEILRAARDSGSKLSMATVYRALAGLERAGLVSRLATGGGPAAYELVPTHSEPHCHLICLGCGRVFEIGGLLPEGFVEVVAKAGNFRVASGSIGIFGYCKQCESKQEAAKRKEM